jgi:hypothetical protein
MSELWNNVRGPLTWLVCALAVFFGISGAAEALAAGRPDVSLALPTPIVALLILQQGVSFALGTLLVVRGRSNLAALLLGLMLLGIRESAPLAWAPQWTYVPLRLAEITIASGFAVYQLGFALVISGVVANRRISRIVWAVAGAFTILFFADRYTQSFEISVGFDVQPIADAAGLLSLLGSVAIIAWGYRHNDQAGRNRLKIVFAAFGVFLVAVILLSAVTVAGGPIWWSGVVWALLSPVALALLTYATLKQRLFDFGFAINRTLVYGAAAFTLLVTFGLVEYGAKSMIPVAWPTAGPFISAGVAVLLFLMFHRLHHWFEHHIERLFFSSWQRAEAALKRFVHSAGHYEQVPALCRDFTGELERFSGGAAAALYLRGDSGGFELQAGKVPGATKGYAEDGRGFALMRTERKPIDLARADNPLPGALALPMLDQGQLLGFALVGAKPDGAHYRPDEIENLDWAVHHIGLDIRALHARLLEERVGELTDENASLTERNERIAADRDRFAGMLERLSPGR